MRFRKLFTGAGLLGISPLLLAGTTFLALPIIMVTLGPAVWAALVVGQAIGEILRVLVIWGWNSLGIAKAVGMSPTQRFRYYLDSFPPRLVLLALTMIPAVVIVIFLPDVPRLAVFVMAATGAIYGLASGWMLIATDRPVRLLTMDTLPRAATTIGGALVLFVLPSPLLYAAINFAGAACAVTLPYLFLRARARQEGVSARWLTWREMRDSILAGAPFVGVGMVMVLRMSAPVAMTPFIAPAGIAQIALGDKFVRWVNTAVTPLIQSLQVRIPEGEAQLSVKARRGVLIMIPFALTLGVVGVLAAYFGSPIISAGEISLTVIQSISVGVFVAALFSGGVVGNSVLIMLGQQRALFRASVSGLIVLVILFPLMLSVWGVSGGLAAWALSEVAVVTAQLIAVRSWRRKEFP